jgi:hypothetical protein
MCILAQQATGVSMLDFLSKNLVKLFIIALIGYALYNGTLPLKELVLWTKQFVFQALDKKII